MSSYRDSLLLAAEPLLLSKEDQLLLEKACNVAEKAHKGQQRKNGAPYVIHVFAAATTVAKWNIDLTTVIATVLHDTLEDTNLTGEEIERDFGAEVLFLVQGVTKISRIKYRGNQDQVETLKKMILALSEDVRVVFVKLADRFHNMSTLEALPKEKQQRIAQETTEIYAPLAYRLGLTAIAGDLEDLAFPYLYPKAYKELRSLLDSHKGERHIADVKKELSITLVEQNIPVIRVDSRVKRISSLYKKLQKYGMDISRVHDLMALRVIVPSLEDCYGVLGIIHSKWRPLPGHIKDYIALPKPNGYRSLHTTVITSKGRPVEFQIRTQEMHDQAEYGIAAHWAYNEGKTAKNYKERKASRADQRQLEWVNQLKQWQKDFDSPDDFIETVKIDFFKNRIFVITPKGEAIDLPQGATPVDFAYSIHTEVGNQCIGARINGQIAALDTELESGDLVEILTQAKKKPSYSWLEFVKTRHARLRIKHAERKRNQIHPRNLQLTITALDRVNLVRDITTVIGKLKLNIENIEVPSSKSHRPVTVRVLLKDDANKQLDELLTRLAKVHNVQKVKFKRI